MRVLHVGQDGEEGKSMNKDYEILVQERDDLREQLEQYKHLKGHSSYKMAEKALNSKRLEIKTWIKSHPKQH